VKGKQIMPYNIQGNSVNLGTDPFILHGKNYIPLRDVVEQLGGTIAFDNNTKIADATIGPWTAHVQMGDQNITVDGNGSTTPVQLTAPTFIDEKGEMFVPFDFLRDAFGYEVSFSGDTLNIVNPNAM
jgi:hypothetical protein